MARELDVMWGDEKDYEIGCPENRRHFEMMRKNIRIGGPRAGCTLR